MKQHNAQRNGSLYYLAGISSPSAANLTVQGLADSPKVNVESHIGCYKTPKATKKKAVNPFVYLAGVSSPSAANPFAHGLNVRF